MDNKSGIERACIVLGGQVKLADALGVTPQAVYLWKKSGKVPAERVLAVEAATGGGVTRHELRPDIFGVAA